MWINLLFVCLCSLGIYPRLSLTEHSLINLLTQLLFMYYSHAAVDVILFSIYYFVAAFCLD